MCICCGGISEYEIDDTGLQCLYSATQMVSQSHQLFWLNFIDYDSLTRPNILLMTVAEGGLESDMYRFIGQEVFNVHILYNRDVR
jgi:hypothetical protein